MRIQKYIGDNEAEILQRIKAELGPSAIILNTKKIQPKWYLKLFSKEKIEILAAIEDNKEHMDAPIDTTFDYIKDKMSNMEELLTMTANKLENLQSSTYKEKLEGGNENNIVNIIYNHLIDQEVEKEVALSLLKGTEHMYEENNIQDIVKIVYDNIISLIGNADVISKSNLTQGPDIVFFIGPTGVGKTTSIAKITADFSLRKSKEVALITADTYRIAAIEQLRTYAEILSVPIKVIYSHKELEKCISQFNDKDYVFVDTAGRSHKNKEQLLEIKDMLDVFNNKKVYLVVSATTKFKDLMSIIKQYSKLCDNYSIIITKTDETTSIGTILNLKYYVKKSISYVSFGQNVPDDIEVIDGGKYAKILLGSLGDE